jgi:hypothetical protein
VIYLGDDLILSLPGMLFRSIEEAIKEINRTEDKNFIRKQLTSLDDLFNILVEKIRNWSNNQYDTRLLYYKIAFPLLKKLREVGETKFQIIFQQEILKTYVSGNVKVKNYLDHEGYLKLIGEFF